MSFWDFLTFKGQKVISGLYRDTAILTMHNFELEVLPQVAFKLPKTTDKVLILDKLMLVQIGKNTLKLVSAHHAEITIINTVDYNKTKEDPVMQTFVLPRFGFCVLYFLSILSNFLSRGILTKKWHEPKAEQFTKLKFLSYEIDENTKCQEPNGYFCASLRVIYNCSAFGSSHYVSFSRKRLRKDIKTQNPNLIA